MFALFFFNMIERYKITESDLDRIIKESISTVINEEKNVD